MQRFIRKAVDSKCDYAVLEMTSQGSITYRNRFVDLDVFVFTNISPEHIEAHGSYENYLKAKLDMVREIEKSKKKNRTIIVNADDMESGKFFAFNADKKISCDIDSLKPFNIKPEGLNFAFNGKTATSPLSGLFNLYNILMAINTAKSQNISDTLIIEALEKFDHIAGRVQHIDVGQDFKVIVDYAHTPDSLEKIYKVFRPDPLADRYGKKVIGVLGGTGGGRDTWKRGEMGRIAELYCDHIILTDEDPYDEDPLNIVNDVAKGMSMKKPDIIMDRRLAIGEAISQAKSGDVVVITGKGTDPYIMGPNGTKTPWSDARIAEEELRELLKSKIN